MSALVPSMMGPAACILKVFITGFLLTKILMRQATLVAGCYATTAVERFSRNSATLFEVLEASLFAPRRGTSASYPEGFGWRQP
jgi:hypothetical protein